MIARGGVYLPSRQKIWTICQISARVALATAQYKSVCQICRQHSKRLLCSTPNAIFSLKHSMHNIFNKPGAINTLHLTITKLQESDSGKYRCVAKGEKLTQLQHSVVYCQVSVLDSFYS